MSLSVSSAMMTAFGLYHEESNGVPAVEAERIRHMLPLLEGPHGERAGDAIENAAVLKVVSNLRKNGGSEESVELRVIRWRGETKASIRAQMQPILLHYRLQIILVKERTQRRMLEMKETNERVPLVTEYYKTTALKWRLLGYAGSSHAMMATDSASTYHAPASTLTSVQEVKREQQFRESFLRLEDAMLRQVGDSTAATPMRFHIDGRRSSSAHSSGCIAAFSPIPLPPSGTHPEVDEMSESDGEGEREAAFEATVAFVGPANRK
ncbi:hypothetical protein ABL78_0043 [Leptomonas seymouri]|uniref:Uncharacterized protein n=1 Tax=Leptomonas seymouri TaxID=5684 RepID=A0A0N1I2I4_LEPSE|nr:hypothetical protein ABL78_0043 [Leptomonas seymouri]|eukprot:KPI90810.1 hypothetical protein ABL78_0043 [Leptomonas seymouri]